MKKVIRLTESDLVRLVKRVINEQGTTGGPTPPPQPTNNVTFTVPTVPSNAKSCGPKGVEDMKAAFRAKGITHLIPDRGYFVVFNTKKQYCAATAQEIVQIIS
jgi:hypothetical protein